jgi:hypothetical protein
MSGRLLIPPPGAASTSHPIQRECVVSLFQIRMFVEIALDRRVIGEDFRTALSILFDRQIVL